MSVCEEVLEKNVWEEYKYENVSKFRSDLKLILNMSREQLEKVKNSNDAGLSLGIKQIVSLLFSSDSDYESLSKLKEQLALNEEQFFKSDNYVSVVKKVASSSIVEAWSKCIEGRDIVAGAGPQVAVGERFSVTVQYTPKRSPFADEYRITGVTPINATPVEPQKLREGASLGKFSSITQKFVRDSNGPVKITIDFTGHPQAEAKLPKIEDKQTILRKDIVVPGRTFSKFVPSRVDRDTSDADFDSKFGNPALFRCDALLEVRPTGVYLAVRMHGRESEPDHTEVNGETLRTQDYLVYLPEPGWEVERVVSPARAEDTFQFEDMGDHTTKSVIVSQFQSKQQEALRAQNEALEAIRRLSLQPPFGGFNNQNFAIQQVQQIAIRARYNWILKGQVTANGLVQQWDVIGDLDGDEAGTQTGVTVTTYPITIKVKQSSQ